MPCFVRAGVCNTVTIVDHFVRPQHVMHTIGREHRSSRLHVCCIHPGCFWPVFEGMTRANPKCCIPASSRAQIEKVYQVRRSRALP